MYPSFDIDHIEDKNNAPGNYKNIQRQVRE